MQAIMDIEDAPSLWHASIDAACTEFAGGPAGATHARSD